MFLYLFQSTPSVKRVTYISFDLSIHKNISIHTLCEEGDVKVPSDSTKTVNISIHTLCEEGDLYSDTYNKEDVISIHTLCEEGDW